MLSLQEKNDPMKIIFSDLLSTKGQDSFSIQAGVPILLEASQMTGGPNVWSFRPHDGG